MQIEFTKLELELLYEALGNQYEFPMTNEQHTIQEDLCDRIYEALKTFSSHLTECKRTQRVIE